MCRAPSKRQCQGWKRWHNRTVPKPCAGCRAPLQTAFSAAWHGAQLLGFLPRDQAPAPFLHVRRLTGTRQGFTHTQSRAAELFPAFCSTLTDTKVS